MNEEKNIDIVLQSLKAEARGDVEKALALLHSKYTMTWVYVGKNGELFPASKPDFKKQMKEVYAIKGRKYDIKNIIASGDVVMVELIESYSDQKTKKVYRTPEVIIVEMKDGKIKTGRHYCDPRLSYTDLTENQIKKIFKGKL